MKFKTLTEAERWAAKHKISEPLFQFDGLGNWEVTDKAPVHPLSLPSEEPVELLSSDEINLEWQHYSIREHHSNCQCFRCVYGDDAYIFNYHPSEY